MLPFNAGQCLSLVFLSTLLALPGVAQNFAQTVETNNVAATFHIEPTQVPRAGDPVQVWFALRQGEQTISLSECNCALAVYSHPRSDDAGPISNPLLYAIDSNGYRGVPGALVVFPHSGTYQLELQGSAKDGDFFEPFRLTYRVQVRS